MKTDAVVIGAGVASRHFPRAHFVQRTWRGKCAVSH